MSNNVWVAVYNHQYGTDCRVYKSKESCFAWRDRVADEWWEDSFPRYDKPASDIGSMYFALMYESNGPEWFDIQEAEIEE